MNGTLFGRSLWDCGSHVIAVRLDEYPIRRCIHEQVTLQRDEDQGELNVDSTQRPLQGALLIPPVLPVVLITMTIHLPEHLERYVHDQVQAGRYSTENEVISDALEQHRQAELTPAKTTCQPEMTPEEIADQGMSSMPDQAA